MAASARVPKGRSRGGQCFLDEVVRAPKLITRLLHHQGSHGLQQGGVKRVGAGMLLDALFRGFNRRDYGPGRDKRSVRLLELGVDRSEIAGRAHVDVVSAQDEKSAGALCLIRDDDREFTASGLGLTNQPKGGLAVASPCRQDDVKVFLSVCIEQCLFEQLNAMGEEVVLHDHEAAVVLSLILADQALALISCRVACLV